MTGLTDILTTIQNGVVAVSNLGQILTQATVNSSSLRVQLTGVVTQINTGSGLTGGPITSTGTISLLSSVGTVTQINSGTGLTGGPITASGTLAVSLSFLTNSLSSDVSLTNVSSYFDGPIVAQGSSGTWAAFGSVTIGDTGGAATFDVRLTDGTNVMDSTETRTQGASNFLCVGLSGIVTSPSSNIRMQVKDTSATTGLIKSNQSGNSKDSTISVLRIA